MDLVFGTQSSERDKSASRPKAGRNSGSCSCCCSEARCGLFGAVAGRLQLHARSKAGVAIGQKTKQEIGKRDAASVPPRPSGWFCVRRPSTVVCKRWVIGK